MPFLSANPRFLNTVLLGGAFTEKLPAIAAAGFTGVEVWQQDAEENISHTKHQLDSLSLTRTDYQVLLNFDGAVGPARQQKRQEALRMIAVATKIDSPMILVAANTAECDRDTIVPDLKWLCQQANAAGLRVAYEAMAWSTEINQCDKAWQILQQVSEENLGIVIDAFHLFALRRTLTDLADIPADNIFLVQLSDIEMPQDQCDLKQIARHHRLLPGEGNFPLTDLVHYLDQLGYTGPVGLEVFNDKARQRDNNTVTREAKSALERLLNSAES